MSIGEAACDNWQFMTNSPTENQSQKPADLALRGGVCIVPSPSDPSRLVRARTSIAIRNGKISEVSETAHENAREIIDATGLMILPGVIDSQVHFREPGITHKEDLETGTRGAVLGGVTSVFEMPNTKPSTTSLELFEAKLKLAEGRVWSDISFFIGATPDNFKDLPTLERHPNCCAVKIFMGSSTGSLLVDEDEALKRVLASGSRRVAVHSEDEARLKERRHIADAAVGDPSKHPIWRDEQTAIIATQRLLRLARETGRRIHVLHVTTAEEMELLKQAKEIATVEVTPQHLTLVAPECYEKLGTLAQMNPPIRDARHRDALWKALNDGTVTVLGSDHAPHTLEEKAKKYPDTPSGMTGVQTMLPIMLDHVNQGRLTIERLVELLCRNNAQLYNAVGKGELRVGYDADFSIVDLGREMTIENKWIASRSAWTPYDGWRVKGWPIHTIVRGNVVVRDCQLQGSPIGKPIRFES